MTSRSSTYLIRSADDIHKVPDLRVAVDLLRKYNIEIKGIKNKQEAIDRLLYHKDAILPVSREEKLRPKSQKVLDDVITGDRKNRQELEGLIQETKGYLRGLPQTFQDDLDDVFPKYETSLKARAESLKDGHCSILVAGETGAGKSSFLNLILGGDFLPVSTDPMSCTSTFCEMVRSDTKRAIVYDRSHVPKRIQEIPLSGERGFEVVHRYMKEVDEDGESPYDRIELHWPFPLLQNGMVIIDSPGIGGNRRTADRIYRYLEKAFGFIYVINPGAIQKDRLEQLLSVVVNSGEEEFDASSTIFVTNKWDLVPEEEEQRVKNYTMNKLDKLYPGLRPNQVYYISIARALVNLKNDIADPALDNLLSGFKDLFPQSLKSRLGNHYRWLSAILKRARYSIRVTRLMDAKSIEEKEKMFSELRRKIERLELDAEDHIHDLRKEVETQIATVKSGLINLFKSPEFQTQFSKWEPSECPKEEKPWRKIVGAALTKVTLRLSYNINIWNVRTGIADSIDDKIVQKFKTDFELLEDQITAIEGVMLNGDRKMVTDIHKSIKKQMPVKTMWRTGGKKKEDEGCNVGSIGGAISSLGSLDTENKEVKRLFKNYHTSNAPEAMGHASRYVIDSLMRGDHLRKGLQLFFGRILRGIDEIAKMIPDFLKADRRLMRNLSKEVEESEKNLYTVYAKANENYERLQGVLDMFYVRKLNRFDFSMKELIWDQRTPPLGSGSFADVYLCEMYTLTGKMHVAAKKCRDKLDESNVTDILLEDRILRDLDHPNIVKYFGSTHDLDRGNMRWIMILEFCDNTLKHLIKKDFDCPGKFRAGQSQDNSMRTISVYIIQMCDGLQYLHNKGLVHRDLKPDNILIRDGNVLKLTDVGMARAKTEITGTIAGSPVYMAPEVLLQKGLYDHRADIYSLGIILWELWYGLDAADHMERQMFGTFEETIKRGVRPSLTLENRPSEKFVILLKGCWEAEPSKRPAVLNIATFFERYRKVLSDE